MVITLHCTAYFTSLIFTPCLDHERWIWSHYSVLYLFGNLALSFNSNSSDGSGWEEKGTLPKRNAEELPIGSRYHKDSQTQWQCMTVFSLCKHHGNFLFFLHHNQWLSCLMLNLGFSHVVNSCSPPVLLCVFISLLYASRSHMLTLESHR